MTSQNPTKTDSETSTILRDDAEQATSEQPEVKKELDDEEIASVAGGHTGPINGKPSGPLMYD
jgi:hypothetical protein